MKLCYRKTTLVEENFSIRIQKWRIIGSRINLWIHPLKITTRAKKERGKISYDINFNANNLEGMKALCLKRKKNSFHQASHRVDKVSFTLNISNIETGPKNHTGPKIYY